MDPQWSHHWRRGGPITGAGVVPCPWRSARPGGPMRLAGDRSRGGLASRGGAWRSVTPSSGGSQCTRGRDRSGDRRDIRRFDADHFVLPARRGLASASVPGRTSRADWRGTTARSFGGLHVMEFPPLRQRTFFRRAGVAVGSPSVSTLGPTRREEAPTFLAIDVLSRCGGAGPTPRRASHAAAATRCFMASLMRCCGYRAHNMDCDGFGPTSCSAPRTVRLRRPPKSPVSAPERRRVRV